MSAFNVVLGCVMALLIILFTTSAIARYYIKFVLFVVAAVIFSTAPLPLMLFRPFNPKNALIPAALLRWTARLLLGIRFEVRGLENIDNSRGTVVLLNHQSCLDLYVLAVLWPLMARCTVISKRTMQYLVPFGTAAWMWGTVFIDRGSRSAHDALNVQATAVKEQKRKLLLFPEGTRHSGDKLLPFRKGAFHVAMDAGAPIQPVVASKYHFLDDKRHKFGSGDVIVTILPMVETSGMTKEDLSLLIEKTQVEMQDTFTRTSAETLARHASKQHAD
ncbi:1-acyl-sn-glycerol-3-phosphate acyltransferase alpha [Cydia splendana]|uniref:1-acyl-sn-glycerol-3-phosphate acyltransferase alpha n=1 Tax=Cydia splendana TaxID=1100963 RepID=UPI00211F66E9